ncbi:MAG: hypothetical protein CM15mP130_1740 [Verrucomicrobiota bacterium]|nr:MAG: hypothetical protein CM15mP130_1740 [Verrucomicrobiota bacterium]
MDVLDDLKQRGEVMHQWTRCFDSIVLGERKAQTLDFGSNGFARTEDFVGSKPEVFKENPFI